MKPKFTIKKSERLMVSDKYICNGHWLVTKEAVEHSPGAPKPLKKVLHYKNGKYENGEFFSDDLPNFETVIPKRDKYKPINADTIDAKIYAWDGEIKSYILYFNEDEKIGLNPNYYPLITMGNAFAKDAKSPILVLDSEDLNGNLQAVVMPMRL